MDEVEILILPNGDIQISRSIRKEDNQQILEILREVVDDPVSLQTFLEAGNLCEQLIGDEPRCG